MLSMDFYLIGGLGTLAFISVIALIIRTFWKKKLKGFKKLVKTIGVVDKVHPEKSVIDCSYIDNHGERRTASFQIIGSRFKKGDEIAICFDADAPEKNIPECTLKAGKQLWLKILLVMTVILAGVLLVLAILDHFGILENIWEFWYRYKWNHRYHH